MDETTTELLSRFLDGDLEVGDEARVEGLLASSEEARRELEGMRRVRRALRAVAEGDGPPDKLDRLLEPLRRTVPTRPAVRPAFGWLAAAASVLLAVGVAFQVARHDTAPPAATGPPPRPAPQAAPAPEVAPPPTAARRRDPGELVGAADRFLATPVPQPAVPAPPPVDAVGPLPRSPASEELDRAPSRARPITVEGVFAPEPEGLDQEGTAAEDPPLPAPGREVRAERVEPSKALSASGRNAARDSGRAAVEVVVEGNVAHLVMAADGTLPQGEYGLRLGVVSGRVASCAAASDEERRRAVEAICRRLADAAVRGLADGGHDLRLVVD